jgi:hypothetical protein
MKASLTTTLTSVLLLVAPAAMAQTEDTDGATLRPTGQLNLTRTYVRTGERPLLQWDISYPLEVADLISFDANAVMTTKLPTQIKVRLANLRVKNNNGHGNNLDGVDVSNPGKGLGGPNGAIDLSGDMDDEAKGAKLYIQTGSSEWLTLFSGEQTDVQPAQTLFEQTLQAGQSVALASHLVTTEGTRYAASSTIILVDGSPLPDRGLKSHLSSFLGTNNTISLGPREALVLFEVNSGDTSSSAFDIQDVAVVVTFGEDS